MSCGRINSLAITTRQGAVIYERFYEQFSETEKAEIRGAFDGVAGPSSAAAAAAAVAEDAELVGRFRCVVLRPSAVPTAWKTRHGVRNAVTLMHPAAMGGSCASHPATCCSLRWAQATTTNLPVSGVM